MRSSSTMAHVKLLLIALLILHCGLAHCRGHNRLCLHSSTSEQNLVSNGVDESNPVEMSEMVIIESESVRAKSSSAVCEETYGFLPCTKTVLGNLFLLGVYGFFMFKAANLLNDGSELLLDVMGPGIVGGLFLPILGALPDALLILVSGISGSAETAQQQVLIGIGLLAGSTVMLLTVLWGSCLVVGKCDLNETSSMAIDSQDKKGLSLYGSGVTIDNTTRITSWIMVATILPFIILQIPLIFNLKSGKHGSVLVACIIALLSLLGYCVFQIMRPWVQKRKLDFLKHRHIISYILAEHHKRYGGLFKANGEPDKGVIERVFRELDADQDGHLSKGELRGLIVGLEIDAPENEIQETVNRVMSEMDVHHPDNQLSKEEFTDGICKWIQIAVNNVDESNPNSVLPTFHRKSKEELEASMDKDEESDNVVNKYKVYLKASLLLVGGSVIAGLIANPLVDALDSFSDATNIPSFFISFTVLPLINSSDGISALIFASGKKKTKGFSGLFSDIWCCDNEQHIVLGSFLGHCVFPELGLDLFS